MSTRCTIYVKLDSADKGSTVETMFGTLQIPEDAEYMGIYCHHDGYPEGVGCELENNYTTYKKAFDLVSNGDTSTVEPELEECAFYSRSEGYVEHNRPGFTNEKPEVTQEYLYVFENGEWSVYSDYFEDNEE